MRNLFQGDETTPFGDEFVETLIESGDVRIERIVSSGQVSPPGFWYDQDEDEWVALLEGQSELEYTDGRRVALTRGDWVLIPAHCRHRVAYTDSLSRCVWLAVFICK
jgi:cupin 2 domain-containing protein